MTLPLRRGAAVLGSPIAHSLSPVLHAAAYRALGLDEWSYRAVRCDEAGLPDTLHALDDEGLAGVSLTMPLKRVVLPLLARTERLARDVGAVNTVLFGEISGQWWGGNTDVPGFVAALRGAGVSSVDSAMLLGGGATAMSAVAALSALGAQAVTVVVRRAGAAVELADVAAHFGVEVTEVPWPRSDPSADAVAALGGGLVVSTVPAGGSDGLVGQLPAAVSGVLFDVVYAPWPTPLAKAWAARGGTVVGGLALLVEQAAEQVRLMTGLAAPVEAMRAAGEAELARRSAP